MPAVRRATFNSYAGPRIAGTESFSLPENATHWDRVLWLTSTVESGGRFGAITMYDGTAVTAGLHQAVAVYPRELADEDFNAADDQGSFWRLLRLLELVPNFPEVGDLFLRLKGLGWYVGTDGSLRYWEDGKTAKAGDLVLGKDIREAFTPNQGAVPSSGPLWETSKSWALAFHRVFSHPKSFKSQIEFGAQHFVHAAAHKKISARGLTQTIDKWLYSDRRTQDFTPSYDLALAVFWSHSVNAPSVAYSLLTEALAASNPKSNPDLFAGVLLRLLGKKEYGRWHFSETSGRWQRTRSNARHVWPTDLFTMRGVMPTTL